MRILTKSRVCACAAAVFCVSAMPQSFERPSEEAIVKAQGVHAGVQLKVMAAFMGADPSGLASREAIEKGWAPVNRGYASPTHGWPARGPSLGESIEPLFAQARAAQLGCKELEGTCQARAAAWAKEGGRSVRAAKNPGREFARLVQTLG